MAVSMVAPSYIYIILVHSFLYIRLAIYQKKNSKQKNTLLRIIYILYTYNQNRFIAFKLVRILYCEKYV